MKDKIISFLNNLKEKLNQIIADKKQKTLFIILTSAVAVLLITVIGFGIYVGDYYRADWQAIDAAIHQNGEPCHSKSWLDVYKKYTVYESETSYAGLIFYPGGKVESAAYEPLMNELAKRGILCVLVDMPFNLAVLDVNAADVVINAYPEIHKWYIAGHSLGGSMAAAYIDSHPELDGLILLGSYSTANVSDEKVLSIYGSNDGVMNREKYEQYKSNLPSDFTELIIEGGNHAYFGMYGEQAGDGKAEISPMEQINTTVDCITEFINR